MGVLNRWRVSATTWCLLVVLTCISVLAQQQLVDSEFKVSVQQPAYPTNAGPTVAIDEAHSNFHTAGGHYKPLVDLLIADGYQVTPSTFTFDGGALSGVNVLVIANARDLAALRAGDLTKSAFSDRECDTVRDWVRAGGSLLLVADHAPFGYAAATLGERFGVVMGKGWTFDQTRTGGITTQLDFSQENGLLGDHVILRGRSPGEAIGRVRSFTGQSLGAAAGASILLKLSPTSRDAATPADLDAEDAAAKGGDASGRGTHSKVVAGPAQGIAMTFGAGRVVVLGEAAMLTAQVLRDANGTETKFGMNAPGNDDRQFALNVFHWLSRVLP